MAKLKTRNLTPDTKQAIKIQYKFVCQCCGKVFKVLEIHHLDLNKHNDDPDNLRPLCIECHRFKLHLNRTTGEVDITLTEELRSRTLLIGATNA